MKFKGIITTALAALAFAAGMQNEIVPESTIPSVRFGQESISLANSGETAIAAVSANCDWALSTTAVWRRWKTQATMTLLFPKKVWGVSG